MSLPAPEPGASIHVRELTATALLRLHSLQTLLALREALAGGGFPLPTEVNQCLGQDPAVLCLAPGEWLVCSERMEFSQLSRPLKAALDTRLTTVLDFSAGLTVLRLEGSGVPWLLNKLCPLDVQGGMNRGSHCARTRLQQAGVVLHCRESSGPASTRVFDLIVDRSLARYTRDLLIASIPHAEELNRSFGNRL